MGRRKSELTYMLPHTVYQETIWFIRDYPNMKLRAEEILASSSAPDGGGRGSEHGDPTAKKAEQYTVVAENMRAVEKALLQIPEEYRADIFHNILFRTPYSGTAGRKTYARWRRRFVFWVAINRKRIY